MSLDGGYEHVGLKIFIMMDPKQCPETTRVTEGKGVRAHVWLLPLGLYIRLTLEHCAYLYV